MVEALVVVVAIAAAAGWAVLGHSTAAGWAEESCDVDRWETWEQAVQLDMILARRLLGTEGEQLKDQPVSEGVVVVVVVVAPFAVAVPAAAKEARCRIGTCDDSVSKTAIEPVLRTDSRVCQLLEAEVARAVHHRVGGTVVGLVWGAEEEAARSASKHGRFVGVAGHLVKLLVSHFAEAATGRSSVALPTILGVVEAQEEVVLSAAAGQKGVVGPGLLQPRGALLQICLVEWRGSRGDSTSVCLV